MTLYSVINLILFTKKKVVLYLQFLMVTDINIDVRVQIFNVLLTVLRNLILKECHLK